MHGLGSEARQGIAIARQQRGDANAPKQSTSPHPGKDSSRTPTEEGPRVKGNGTQVRPAAYGARPTTGLGRRDLGGSLVGRRPPSA